MGKSGVVAICNQKPMTNPRATKIAAPIKLRIKFIVVVHIAKESKILGLKLHLVKYLL